MSWDEMREKSHGYVWRNTTIYHLIDYADMLREMGGGNDFIEYLKDPNKQMSVCW
jgi:hypothetical protein